MSTRSGVGPGPEEEDKDEGTSGNVVVGELVPAAAAGEGTEIIGGDGGGFGGCWWAS